MILALLGFGPVHPIPGLSLASGPVGNRYLMHSLQAHSLTSPSIITLSGINCSSWPPRSSLVELSYVFIRPVCLVSLSPDSALYLRNPPFSSKTRLLVGIIFRQCDNTESRLYAINISRSEFRARGYTILVHHIHTCLLPLEVPHVFPVSQPQVQITFPDRSDIRKRRSIFLCRGGIKEW